VWGLCLLLCVGCVCYCVGVVFVIVWVVFVIVIFVRLFRFNNVVWDEVGEVCVVASSGVVCANLRLVH